MANDMINKCIQDCRDTANKLRSMTNTETNMQVRTALEEGAHHLDLCITECQYSLQQISSK
ncbi:MAG: hypothetical protein A2Y23_03770 [Clostridiales bacterium GWB2_37_7]|nr:MAG: hypothetical protein A2Y23_03770 [Clostridiales bacterium GWB2_37_7]